MNQCVYCGFWGTNDEMMEHAGKCEVMLEDYQPEEDIEKESNSLPNDF